MHALCIDLPALSAEQARDPAVAKARILFGKLVHTLRQWPVLLGPLYTVALRRMGLTQHLASPPLTDAQLVLNITHGVAAARPAQ